MKLKNKSFVFALLLFSSCGDGELYDAQGLMQAQTASEQFTRASQLYFRGRLTAALDEFNGVIYRYPDSRFADDARLAVRRLESDLADEQPVAGNVSMIAAAITVVGKPQMASRVHSLAEALGTIAANVTEKTDAGASDLTVVFYKEGFDAVAAALSDSMEGWLSRPEGVPIRQGEELIGVVAPDCDLLVVVGSDVAFSTSLPEVNR